MDFSDSNFSFETYQRSKIGMSMIPNSIQTNIAKINESKTQLFLEYLYSNKIFTYIENLNDTNFIIAASNEVPLFSVQNVTFEISAYDIFQHIKYYAHKLLPDKDILNEYNIKIHNFAIIYCNRTLAEEISIEISKTYKITVIPIYTDDLLHFDYINNYINYDFKTKKGPKIQDRVWKNDQTGPTMKDNNDQTVYNTIIEKIFKLNLQLLDTYNVPDWSFETIYLDIKRDVELDSYDITGKDGPNKSPEQAVCEDYLYQIWLYYTHIIRYDNSLTTIYKSSINTTDPSMFDVINASNRIIGGNLTLEESNENTIHQIISSYAKDLSTNQKKYLKQFHKYEKLKLIKTLDVLTIIELKKNMDARQTEILELYQDNNFISKQLGFDEKTSISLIIIGIITLAVIILSILILVL